jgi:hypothetical protein
MATPINGPLTNDIWHLSIDDLLEPIVESPRLGGPGPFVINLSASSAPLSPPAKGFTAGAGAHVYQIQRMEDRRPRYRLRLGPFATEDEAEAILAVVRDVYPSALTATAESDDMRAITALKPKPDGAPPVAAPPVAVPHAAAAPVAAPAAAVPPVAAPQVAARPVVAPQVAAPHVAAAAAAVPPVAAAPAAAPAAAVPRAAAPPIATPAAAIPPVAAPHVAAPLAAAPRPPVTRPQPAAGAVSIPVLSDSVEIVRRTAPRAMSPPAAISSPPPSPAARAAAAPTVAVNLSAKAPTVAAAKAAPSIAQPAATPAAPLAAKPAAPPHRVGVPNAPRPSVESTQTLRALTVAELQDPAARWYVIQLSLSEESFDPDSLPNLDIFNEYRLYSVAGIDHGRILHALRLGFFAEEGAAAAVASYLGEFYEKPTVKRISVAERERFRDQRVEARKDIGATGKHAVIEITGERHIRDNRPRIATVTPLAPAAASSARIGRN